jgi:hypothetical protein
MRPSQHHQDISAFEVDALFASALQCSEAPSADQVRRAIDAAVREFGLSGCAGRVAQEFGDHPEAAVVRMRWARVTASSALRGQAWLEPSRSQDLTALCAA